MSDRSLEKRVAALEKEVAELRAIVTDAGLQKDWRRTIGMFAGDEIMREIDQAALEYREKDRARARKRFGRSPGKKKD